MYVFAALYMRRVEAGTWCQYVYIPVYVFMYLFRLKRHPSREMENSSEAHLCKQAACDMLMRSRVQRDLFMTSPDLAKTNNRSVGEFPGSFVMYIQRTAVVRTRTYDHRAVLVLKNNINSRSCARQHEDEMSSPALGGVLSSAAYETTLPTPFSSCHLPLIFHTATRSTIL